MIIIKTIKTTIKTILIKCLLERNIDLESNQNILKSFGIEILDQYGNHKLWSVLMDEINVVTNKIGEKWNE